MAYNVCTMPQPTVALDASARRIDVDGRLHVSKSHISKAVVNPYYGSEVPDYEALGLEAGKIYHFLRHPDELKKAAGTFARLPILRKHQPVTVDIPAPELVVGAIGSDVSFAAPYLDADLCIWDKSAIAGIDTGKVKELSCGYRWIPVMTPGDYEGVRYDGVMTEIVGNHLALVEFGRAGSDVVVADSSPFKIRPMKMTKLGKALYIALSGLSPKIAQDSATQALFAEAKKAEIKRDEIKSKLIALDAELSPERLDAVLDAILDVEQNPEPQQTTAAAKDESPAGKLRELLAGKCDEETITAACALMTPAAADEDKDGDTDKKIGAAMDGFRQELRQQFADAAKARDDVRPVVGAVALDSAAEIYGFALDHLKVDRKGVEGVAALRALYHAAQKPTQSATVPNTANDGAIDVTKLFPGAARFK